MNNSGAPEPGRWQRFGLGLAALALSLGLAACGGGEGGGSNGGGEDLFAHDYMPTAANARWQYQDSDGNGNGSYLTRVLGSRPTDRGTGMAVKSDLADATEVIIVHDTTGVWQYPGSNAGPLDRLVGPMLLLPSPLRVGSNFVFVDKDLGSAVDVDGDGLNDTAKVRGDTTIVAIESLDTAAGRLTDCLHLRLVVALQVSSTRAGRDITVSTTRDEWYAAGIGLVKVESVTRDNAGHSASFSQRVLGYRVGDKRTDTVAPTASAERMDSPAALPPSMTVEINFSEDMDISNLASSLRVLDAQGAIVSGSNEVVWQRSLRFRPAAAWVSGSYSARLDTTATDLLGNSTATEQVWHFVIDASAPVLVGANPLEGTVDVALATTITLNFNEDIDPASLNANTLMLTYDGNFLSRFSYEVNGRTLVLIPDKPLLRGRQYSILLNGVTDMVGNAMRHATVSFTADPGRFGSPLELSPVSNEASAGAVMAVGDFNGDGRQDVAADYVRWSGSEWRFGVQIYAQQADGKLGPATELVLPDNCAVRSMQVADMDGDGRQDLLISASDACGVMLWRQTSTGQLTLDRAIDPTMGLMQIADLNGDGRPDLVVASSATIKVWLNTAGGWVLQDTLALPARPNQLALGDINGDGRPDIAVASIERREAVALSLQGANGHFGTLSSLSNDYGGGSFGVAIGDINGDGRADLLVLDGSGIGAFYQQADGQLASYSKLDDSGIPRSAKIVDINGDGRLDVLVSFMDADLAVYLQQADGTLAGQAVYPGTLHGTVDNPDQLAVGDFNGDGRLDVALHNYLFTQRPVEVMSQSVHGHTGQTTARRWQDSLQQALRQSAAKSVR